MCTIIESDAASHLNLSSPIPYRKIRSCVRNVNFGINFAYGGSGVLFTLNPTYRNISTQIQELRYLVNNAVVSKKLIASSTCVLVIVGNDYTLFLSKNPPNQVSVMFTLYNCFPNFF